MEEKEEEDESVLIVGMQRTNLMAEGKLYGVSVADTYKTR